jgi:hypothetical protein
MRTLIVKLNATGDVVRTTTLLHALDGEITWVTAPNNVSLLQGTSRDVTCLRWQDRAAALDRSYDLVINLEDELEVAAFVKGVRTQAIFGAYLDARGSVSYTDNAKIWFDMSLISVHGRQRADELKLQNRRSYQELIFEGLGLRFAGEPYVLPTPTRSNLTGDVAIAPVAGAVWPMKNWAYYDVLKERLEEVRLKVNFLTKRTTLLDHRT